MGWLRLVFCSAAANATGPPPSLSLPLNSAAHVPAHRLHPDMGVAGQGLPFVHKDEILIQIETASSAIVRGYVQIHTVMTTLPRPGFHCAHQSGSCPGAPPLRRNPHADQVIAGRLADPRTYHADRLAALEGQPELRTDLRRGTLLPLFIGVAGRRLIAHAKCRRRILKCCQANLLQQHPVTGLRQSNVHALPCYVRDFSKRISPSGKFATACQPRVR